MADENKIEIQITLDDGKVVQGIANVKKEISSIQKPAKDTGQSIEEAFSETKIGSFVTKIRTMNPVFLGAATAVAGFGASLAAALKSEEIERINRQFNVLAEQAGLVGSTLEEQLVRAADGLADTEDILMSASNGILLLGENAKRLPEIFELAKRSANAFGGTVTENFERISNAIAAGSVKQLRGLGIVVDSDKAYKDLAKTLGVTEQELTASQKQFAFANATIESGQKAFKNLAVDTNTVTAEYQRLKVSIGEFFDTLATGTSSVLGPFVRSILEASRIFIDVSSGFFGATKKEATTLEGKIIDLTAAYNKNAEALKGLLNPGLAENLKRENIEIQKQISSLKQRADAINEEKFLRASRASAAGIDVTDGPKKTAEQEAEAARKSAEKRLFTDQLLLNSSNQLTALKIQNAQKIEDEEQRIAELSKLTREQIANEEAQFEINKDAIEQLRRDGKLKSTQDFNTLIEQETARHEEAKKNIQITAEQTKNAKIKQLNDQLRAITVSGIVSTVQNITKALISGENAFKAFGQSVLNLFADLATQTGQFFIASGIAKLTFLKDATGTETIAAGAALVALGTIFRSVFGGGGESSAASSSASSASPGSFDSVATAEAAAETIEEKTTQVKIDVAGTVLDPIGVGRQIAQILNDTFEATGTKVVTT